MLSDLLLINIAAEDYVESWFSYEKASQIFAVRSKTDKSPSTNKTMALDVHAKRHQLENVVRVKQESEARTQSPKRDNIKNNRKEYRSEPCLMQDILLLSCRYPATHCKYCSLCLFLSFLNGRY